MPSAWRLTSTAHVHTAWDGEGARRAGGRWNSPGTRVVYASAMLSLALTEMLVHLPANVLPNYTAIPVEFDDGLMTVLDDELPMDWTRSPPPRSTQTIGDAWVRDATSAVLRVPSVIVPMEFNYVINPRHADIAKVRIGTPVPFPFDHRLIR